MRRPQEAVRFNSRDFQELKKLVAQGEGPFLEFKRKAAHPEKIVREMVAFANTRGGTLLLGVGDDLTLPGLKYPEDESLAIIQALKKCKPPLPVVETFIPIGNARTIIRYVIRESERKPHFIAGPDSAKESFVRVNDQSIKASREVVEIVTRARKKKDIQFYYGDHERFLMQYLDTNPTITLKKFMELSGLKRFYASRKLVLLVLADVLNITPHEKGDLYSLAFKA
jgi:hypothetical protein